MDNAIINALSVLLIIAISYFFKRVHLVDIAMAKKLAYVVMYLTLPCAILTSANGIAFDVELLSIILISFAINFGLLLIAFFSARKVELRMFNMLNTTCFNIGNFVIPFMQHTMSPVNALFCFGGSYSVALFFNRKYFPDQEINLKTIFKEMAKSLPFYIYALVITLSAFGLSIPETALTPFKTIAGANTLLCFMIIGIALSFEISWEQFKHVMQAWCIRYISCIVMAALIWILVPLEPEIRLTIMIILMAPMTSLAPIMTMRAIPQRAEESADLNTIAIISSLIFITIMNSIGTLLL